MAKKSFGAGGSKVARGGQDNKRACHRPAVWLSDGV